MFVQIQDYTLRVSTIYRYIQHLITPHITITLCRDKNISYEQTLDYTSVLILKLCIEFCWSSDQDWVQISNLFSNLKFDFLNEFLIKI